MGLLLQPGSSLWSVQWLLILLVSACCAVQCGNIYGKIIRCYVGPSKTQWRKCSDQYYPYGHNSLDRFDSNRIPWDSSGGLPPPPHNSGFRPDRPNGPVLPPAYHATSNSHYDQKFDDDFLNPPKPGKVVSHLANKLEVHRCTERFLWGIVKFPKESSIAGLFFIYQFENNTKSSSQ